MNTAQQFFDNGEWWQKDGAFKLLHDINPLRLQITTAAAGGYLSGKRLLDVGCGGGIFTEAAAAAGAQVCGVDISAGAIAVAKAHAEHAGINARYECGSVDFAEAEQYDIVTCFEMLEHADNPPSIIADIATMLRPKGVAVLSTINRTLPAWLLMIVGLENTLKILPHGAHEYDKFITPEELSQQCQDCGLKTRRIIGLNYSFFGKIYLLSENKYPVNYFLTVERE